MYMVHLMYMWSPRRTNRYHGIFLNVKLVLLRTESDENYNEESLLEKLLIEKVILDHNFSHSC